MGENFNCIFIVFYFYFYELFNPFLSLFSVGMSLGEVRQLYFQLREEVFAGGVLSISKRTDALEKMLKTQFKDKRLKDVEYPKYDH